ncbi:MAG: TonB-dependent receptor [Gammaproteobacteria bacterium]|nr:TonB-dependent receptor [Gammaproteobacteria bacterium]
MNTNSKLQSAVRLALGMSAGALAVSVAPSALAQDVGADDVEQIEEIITTGSRIKRADLDSASPVTVIDQEDIMVTGVTDVGALLQRLPSMSGSPIGTTTNNGGNGSVQIDLRGMGPIRTLTLVNGKRTVDGGDYQTIPATMIERVEILKDGASAVYGADAVAGVVNIITKDSFDGIKMEVQTADWFDSKGAQQEYSFIAGREFDGGNFLFGAEFVDQEEAFQSDAPWDYFQDSYFIYPGGCEAQLTAPYDGTPQGGCYIVGSSRIPASRLGFIDIDPGTTGRQGNGVLLIDDAQAASVPYEVGIMIPHDGRTYNYAPVNYIQTPYERTNLFADMGLDLTDDIRLDAEIRGNLRNSAQELAPQPYNSPTDPAHSGVFDGGFGNVAYNGISEDNYYLRRAIDAYNAANGTALPYQPVSDARRRMIETTRRFEQEITQIQANATLTGTFNDVDWEVYYNKGWRDRTDVDRGQFSGPRLFNALGPSADLDADGQPECYADVSDPTSIISGCVPFNFFGGGAVAPDGTPTLTTLTQDMIDYVQVDLVDTFEFDQDQGGLSFTGAAFELPGGELGWALGYEYRKEKAVYDPDSAKQQDAVTGNTGAGTTGSYSSDSVYGEVFAPVFDNGTQNLNLKGGVRWDDFSTFGDDTTFQFGVEVGLLEELKFRATVGEVFRAPSIFETFAGQVDSFPTYLDPCSPTTNGGNLAPGCGGQTTVQLDTQVLARVGGNPGLIAESGDTITAGLVWTPTFGDHDFSVTVDWWQIELDDRIDTLGVQFLLDDCYINQNASACSLITRRPDFSIAQILDAPLNVAQATAEGIDTEIRWNFETTFGEFETSLLWAHNTDRTRTAFAGAPEEDLLGRYTDPGEAWVEDKINYSIGWFRNDFSVRYLGEYISDLDADVSFLSTYIQSVDSQLYHDIVFGYDVRSTGTRIAAGITNFTDEEPPYIDFGFNASTDPSTYRLFGIGYYVRLSQSFD